MNKLMYAALAAASIAVPQLAYAQAAPAAVIGILDSQRVMNTCNACKSGIAALEAQDNSLKAFGSQVDKDILTERQAIQTALEALPNQQPTPALQARFTAWEKKRDDSAAQFRARAEQLERNRRYVNQQVSDKLDPAINAVMAKRGMNLVVEAAAVVRGPSAYDITADVLAQLNATLSSVATTAPAGAARPAAARPAAPKPATTPKPSR